MHGTVGGLHVLKWSWKKMKRFQSFVFKQKMQKHGALKLYIWNYPVSFPPIRVEHGGLWIVALWKIKLEMFTDLLLLNEILSMKLCTQSWLSMHLDVPLGSDLVSHPSLTYRHFPGFNIRVFVCIRRIKIQATST